MPQADAQHIQALIEKIADDFGVDKIMEGVEIDRSDPGDDTLRIVVRIKGLDDADVKKLSQFMDAVQDTLIEQDDRFPSIRFSEAA